MFLKTIPNIAHICIPRPKPFSELQPHVFNCPSGTSFGYFKRNKLDTSKKKPIISSPLLTCNLIFIQCSSSQSTAPPPILARSQNHRSHPWSIPRYAPKKKENVCPPKDLHMTAHSSINHNSQQVETTHMFINGWMNKMWYVYTMKYYSAIKRNEVLIHATIWMNLENTMLSERSKSPETIYCMILTLGNVQNRVIYKESRLVFA